MDRIIYKMMTIGALELGRLFTNHTGCQHIKGIPTIPARIYSVKF
jgi:hypothetical protein